MERIAKVEFFQGATKLGEDLPSLIASWATVPAGAILNSKGYRQSKCSTASTAVANQ